MGTACRFLCSVAVLGLVAAPAIDARDLTLEQRVQAQAAIERVYYAHQIGATRPFEEAVPRREVLESKVQTYLRQSAALSKYWHTPVTAEMLERELQRMADGTRMPERLRELFAALDDDPLLIQECLARATLVDRLARSFYAFDPQFHDEARQEAEAIHADLASGALDPRQKHPRRTEVELVRGDERPEPLSRFGETRRLALLPAQFDEWRNRLPDAPWKVDSVDEDREAFHVRVLLEASDARLRVAEYRVEKRPWDTWWKSASRGLDAAITTVASPEVTVPNTLGTPGCAWDVSERMEEGVRPSGGSSVSGYCDSWDSGALDDGPNPRAYHTAVWTGSVMIVWGGSRSSVAASSLNTGGKYDPATDVWTPTSTEGAPAARLDHTAAWTGSLMVVWGGYAEGFTPLDTGGRYDLATDTWSPTSNAGSPASRLGHTAVWTGSQMVVWGGSGASLLNTGGRYDPAADTWTPTSTAGAPSPRKDHTAVWTGSLMVVWAGYPFVNTGGRYDPATNTWTPTSTVPFVPASRWFHTAVWTGNRMVVWGGQGASNQYLNTGARYDPAANTWTTTATAGAPDPRRDPTAVWTGSEMIVWGGYNNGSVSTGGRYDPVTNTWTPISATGAPTNRFQHTAIWTGSRMVVWGGSRNASSSLSTGARYDPVTDTWTPTSATGAPTSRFLHTAIWTGSRMVVWGGFEGSYLNTGARYDPSTDNWTPTSTSQAPSHRGAHTAVWTGDRMVIWGGTDVSFQQPNTGARYDPSTDTWTPTSTAGAPSGRSFHTAAWTGDRMVVWGGLAGSTYLNTGGRYDPATDAWTPTATIDAPAGRYDHTAVWTGSLMVVWGGYNGSYLGTGGRYDPAGDAWTPTSVTAAPAVRRNHTAVWTGTRMVIWGGNSGASHLNTGALYDPVSDGWTPTPIPGAPVARADHSAVWTGSLVLVWGGFNAASHLGSGALYDPATGTWATMSTAGAPEVRGRHTAVWTGSQMLVWGGYDGWSSLGTGGRYSLGQDLGQDSDGDGFDECGGDCNDADPGAHALPYEVTGLFFDADGVTLVWDPVSNAGSATVHDVLVGAIGELPVGSGPSEACLESGVAGTSATAAEVPPSGQGFWYLVRGQNSCGAGTYGVESSWSERTSLACP